MKYLILSLIFLTSCSVKTISKNCMRAQESEYYVCDTLNGAGK